MVLLSSGPQTRSQSPSGATHRADWFFELLNKVLINSDTIDELRVSAACPIRSSKGRRSWWDLQTLNVMIRSRQPSPQQKTTMKLAVNLLSINTDVAPGQTKARRAPAAPVAHAKCFLSWATDKLSALLLHRRPPSSGRPRRLRTWTSTLISHSSARPSPTVSALRQRSRPLISAFRIILLPSERHQPPTRAAPRACDDGNLHAYRVHVCLEDAKVPGRAAGGGPPATAKVPLVGFWCFRPGVCMQKLLKLGVKSIVITSGTLSPMDSFAFDLARAGSPLSPSARLS